MGLPTYILLSTFRFIRLLIKSSIVYSYHFIIIALQTYSTIFFVLIKIFKNALPECQLTVTLSPKLISRVKKRHPSLTLYVTSLDY